MPFYHSAGYISVTSPDGMTAYVRVSKIAYIHIGGDAETLIVLDGDIKLHVKEKIYEVFEKIDAYIAPDMR